MKLESDARVESLFGSRARLLTLAALASAPGAVTGYRVAEITGLPREKVYPELRRAIAAGVVTKTTNGVRLVDPNLRAFLRKRVPIYGGEQRFSWSDWQRARRDSAHRAAGAYDQLARLPHPEPPPGWRPRKEGRFHRSPVKDRILQEMGKPTSIHAD